MRIIIVGCGTVGYALAKQLNEEGCDIVVIDTKKDKIADALGRLDVIGIQGNGASLDILKEAGIVDTHLLIAVTHTDEVNLLCCLIAKKAGNCHTIARVKNPVYYSEIDYIKEELGLSLTINPELDTALDIFQLIQIPSALEVNTFAKGRLNMLRFKIEEGSPLCAMKISEIPKRFTSRFLICIIARNHEIIIPRGDVKLELGDSISIVIESEKINKTFAEFGVTQKITKNVMIFGGGTITYYLAVRLLNSGINVKIVEIDKKRCDELSELLPDATIIYANAGDMTLLVDEGIDKMDAIISLTDRDEENIMLSLSANKLTKAKIITRINTVMFDGVIDDIPIGSIVNINHLTSDSIIKYVRSMRNFVGSNVEAVFNLMDNQVEALEFYIKQKSRVTNVQLSQLKLKGDLLVCAIIRGRHLIIPKGNDSIQVRDTVIIVTTHKGFDEIEDILLSKVGGSEMIDSYMRI